MLGRLTADLGADVETIRQVVERLSADQRHGLRPLPNPLPSVPAIAGAFDGLELDGRDRELLLALAVALDDSLAPLVDLDGRSPDEIASGPIGEHLLVHAGHVRFVDPRLSVWIRATAPTATTARVHERLSAILRRRGDQVGADWHQARGSLERDPATAPQLIRIARRLIGAGLPERAFLLAREAVAHAVDGLRDEAVLVAGSSAVTAGYAAEGAAWLARLYPGGAASCRRRGLGGLFVAHALMTGTVPDVDHRALRPVGDAEDWGQWTRAAALAALMCAERQDRRGMRVWLDEVRQGAARIGVERDLGDRVVALSWLIAGERDVDGSSGSRSVSGTILDALRSAMDGDLDRGLRLLARDDAAILPVGDALIPEHERTPVVQAYRVVVEVLLLAWRGDIGVARDKLFEAALVLPVALPFAGLGVVLARRLDLIVLGELGPYSRALTEALPPGVRIDLLVDRGLREYLAGSFDDAAATVRLWAELGSVRPTMTVPGLEELAVGAGSHENTVVALAPPDIIRAQSLRARLARAGEGRWRSECDDVREAARTLRSPFARARVETMLGTQFAIRDDHVSARIHLLHAERLFELSGATAWARAIRRRLDRLDPRDGSTAPAIDALSACRAAWSSQLTARELEVAMHAIRGAANRDIAEALRVSVRTVEVHLGRVFTKLEVRSRVELTVLAHRAEQHL